MSKTNREKNMEHDRKEILRVRPKQAPYDHKPVEAVIHQWVKSNEQT